MEQSRRIFDVQTRSGEPVTIGDVTVTPQSQALTLRWPAGGFVWNRPLAILVEQDGATERIPVVDVTLMAQVALLALSLLFPALILMGSVLRRRV